MEKIKNFGLLLFFMAMLQITPANAQGSFSSQLSASKRLSVTVYEQLIMFVLTKDESLYIKARETMELQSSRFQQLKNNVSEGTIYYSLVTANITICDTQKMLYDDYFKRSILNDKDKTKKIKYENKEYQVTKSQEKKFKQLLKYLKEEKKRN